MKKQFHQMIHEAENRQKTSQNLKNLRNHLNQSCEEYEFLNMKNSFERLIHNLKYLQKKENVNPSCFINVLNSPNKFSSSILSSCQNILSLLQQEPKIKISHQHHASQVIFLALFLKICNPSKTVTVLTTKLNWKNWQKYMIDQKSTDLQSDLKKLLAQTKVHFHFINQLSEQSIICQNQILILDLMNTEVIQYRPLILKLKELLAIPQKIIVYHSHIDQNDVKKVLDQANLNLFQTQISQTYPIQINYIPKDAQIKQKLIEFLKQDSNHPQKQDVIIFYKNEHLSNSSSKRFCHKLKQLLVQNKIQSHVQLVCDKNQILLTGKNHIFVAQNSDQLLQWNYMYEDVLFLIDYGWNVSYKMDHQKNCYVQGLYKNCLRQKTRRLSFIGISKVGKYIYAEDQYSKTLNYLQRNKQLMTYVLKMIQLELQHFLQKQNSRVKICIQKLIKNEIIQKNQNQKLSIKNQQVLKLNKLGLDPIQSKIIFKTIQKQKQNQQKIITNLCLMSFAIINTKGNLRQVKQNMSAHLNIKPTGIWRKTGYLDSCIQILTKAEIIESGKNTKKSISKRSTSKIQEQFMDGFGDLFDCMAPPLKIQFQDMKMDDLLRQYFVNQNIFAQIRQKVDEMRELFNVQQTNIKFDLSLLNQVIQTLSQFVPDCIGIFSGSRRLGYRYKNQLMINKSIFPHRQCLMSQLNQTPQFILVMRCLQSENKRQFLMCNTVNVQSFMSTFGELPSKKSDSLAEHEIDFHGISSSIFKGLFRNNGIQMQRFQVEHKCFIEPNQQLATITIYCSKQAGQRIKQAFEQFIGKIKQKFINYNKIVPYEGNTNISMSNGGQVKQIIKENYINKCYLNNLDLQVTLQDIQELVDGFFILKNIQILPPQNGKFSKSAIIQFNSQKDYYRFFSYYNQIKYFDRILQVRPISINRNTSIIQQEFLIDFKWFVWKSHQKSLLVFKKVQDAETAFKTLKQNPLLDGSPVQFSIQENKITFNNLHQTIDEIFLQKAFSVYGPIQTVQILKTPLKQPPYQQNLLNSQIKKALQIPNNEETQDKYKIFELQKHKNGLRKCRVLIKNQNLQRLNKLITKLNSVKGIMGQGRIYAESIFTKPILISHPTATHLYQTLLNQTIYKGPQKQNVDYVIKEISNRNYIILSSTMNGALNVVFAEFNSKLRPRIIKLTSLQKNIILSDVGIANLVDLQQKFNCKLIVNTIQKNLEVICKKQDYQKITAQINSRVQQKFFYRISLNTRSYKNLSKDKQKLQQIKKKYFLTLLEIQQFSKTLIFQGSANHVQNALNYMMHLIQSFSKPQQELINTQVCLICYEQPTKPYRLQNCGHKFCFSCLDQCINSVLGDITMFPIKCPHCMIELTIDDLQSLIQRNSWNKLINMGVTQFVNKNSQIMTFCYTAGCKQINMLKLHHFKCDKCIVSYCTECKQRYHLGLTCQEAKSNVDELFKKYMQQNDVRVCPNANCKMPIVRTDGCYRVTCSRCNKSMCFKCPADKMIAYDDYNQCYKHLNDAHGGYW